MYPPRNDYAIGANEGVSLRKTFTDNQLNDHNASQVVKKRAQQIPSSSAIIMILPADGYSTGMGRGWNSLCAGCVIPCGLLYVNTVYRNGSDCSPLAGRMSSTDYEMSDLFLIY